MSRAVLVLSVWGANLGGVETGHRRPLKFTVFAADPIASLAYAPRPGGALRSLEFYPTARSSCYEYFGLSPLEIVDRTSGSVVATIDVPDDLRTALILFVRGDVARGFETRVITGDSNVPRAGETRVLNLSGLELVGAINHHLVTLADNADVALSTGASVRIELRTFFHGRSYPSYTDNFQSERGGSALVILLPPYREGSLEIQSRVLLDQPDASAR